MTKKGLSVTFSWSVKGRGVCPGLFFLENLEETFKLSLMSVLSPT